MTSLINFSLVVGASIRTVVVMLIACSSGSVILQSSHCWILITSSFFLAFCRSRAGLVSAVFLPFFSAVLVTDIFAALPPFLSAELLEDDVAVEILELEFDVDP